MSRKEKQDLPKLLRKIAHSAMLLLFGDSPDYVEAINAHESYLWRGFFTYFDYQHSSDWKRFEKKGLKKDDLRKFLDLIQKMRKMLLMPLNMEKDEPINQISVAYYGLVLDDFANTLEEIDEVIEKCPESLMEEELWVENFRAFENQEHKLGDCITVDIANPYKLLRDNTDTFTDFFDYVEEKSANADLSKLIYSGVYTKVKNITNQLKDNNLSKEEMKLFLKEYGIIILKGFGTCDVMYKLSQNFVFDFKNSFLFRFYGINEDQIILLEQMKCLHKYSKTILDQSIPIFTEDIIELNEKHRNDEIGRILKPLIEEVIPYAQSMTSASSVKLWAKWIKCFEPIYKAYKKNYSWLFNIRRAQTKNESDRPTIDSPFFFPFMIDMLPIVVDEAPSNKYLQNFLVHFYHLSNLHCTLWVNESTKDKTEPVDVDEIDEFTSLNQQKLYIVWYLMRDIWYYNGDCSYMLNALICSVMPWRIDDDSEEARDIEQRITTFIRKACRYCYATDYTISLYNFFSKSIWNATEPLDMELIRTKIDKNYNGCCNIQ